MLGFASPFKLPPQTNRQKKQSSAAQVNGIRCRPSGDLCAIRLSCSVYSGHCLILFFSAYFLIFRRFFIFRRRRFNMKQFIRNFHVFSVYRFNALHGRLTLFKPFSPSSYTVSQTSLRYFLSCDMLIIPPFEVPQRRSYHRTG